MSTTIDQRVVEMRFDNSHFEKNVSTTMSTLDKLKQKLNLSGATKGLDEMNAAAKNNSMPILGNAVETVSAKFSALQVMGVTALANITNSAVNAGKRIVKSLTIDPIKSGFDEYETKMGSIQTILANTEHQGTTLDDVTAALDKLNTYADKTIYNFQQMTRNIGTFTAAGVDLQTSVESIQGIANLAAVSGSTSQQASTAMYQLSQALASGTVKLQDWNSVVNAGMGGKVFQNALIRTAAMLDGSANDVAAWQKKHIDAYGSFRESLSKEQWLTTEVLTTTLKQFTMAAEEGSDEWNEFKKALTSSGYTENQAEEILKMANTATDAATKVKTFTQLMDTLKESAQSGWAQTWELIVGDFEEAKAFFTELSDIFGGILGKSADRRNTFLGDALTSNWDKLISKINEAGVETSKFEESIRKIVGDEKLDNVIQEFGSLEKAVKSGAVSSDVLKKALSNIGATNADGKIARFVDGLKEIEQILGKGDVGEDVEKLQTALNELGYDLGDFGIDGIIGPATEKAIKAFQEANGLLVDGIAGPDTLAALEKAGSKIEETADNATGLTETFDDLVDVITEKSGRELLLDSLMNVIKAIQRPLGAVGEALRDVFSVSPDQLYNALNKINNFTKKLVPKGILDVETWEDLLKTVNKFGIGTNEFVDSLKNTLKSHGVDVDELSKKYGSLGHAFEEGAISFDTIKEALLSFDGISESLLNGGENVEKIRRSFEGLFAAIDIVATVLSGPFKFAFKIVTETLGKMGLSVLDVTANIGDAIVAFRDKVDAVVGTVTDFIVNNVAGWIEEFKETEFFKTVSGWFEDASTKIGTALDNITEKMSNLSSTKLFSIFTTAWNGFLNVIDRIKNSKIGSVISGAVSGVVTGLTTFFSKLPSFTWGDVLGIFTNKKTDDGNIAGALQDSFVGKIKTFFKNLAGMSWDDFKVQAFSSFVNFWISVGDKVTAAFEACKEFAEAIKFFIFGTETVTLGSILDMAEKILGIIVLIKALNLLNGLVEPFDNITEAINNFSASIKWKAVSDTFKSMAIALGVLTICIIALVQMPDMSKAWQAAGMLAGLLIIMGGVALAMGWVSTLIGSTWSTTGVALSLLAMMGAIVLLVKVIQEIDGMKLKDPSRTFNILAAALLAITIGMAVITRAAKAGFGSIAAVLTLILALKQLLDVITLYSEFPWAGTRKGILKMVDMLLVLSTALAISSLGGKGGSLGMAFTLIAMVASLKILLNVIKEFAATDDATLEKGGMAVVKLLGVMTMMAMAINASSNMTVLEKGQRSANSFKGLASALIVVVIAVWALGTLATKHQDVFEKGMTALSKILLGLAAVISLVGFSSRGLSTGVVTTMLIMFAVLMAELAIIIKIMQDVPWQNALGSMGGIAIVLLAMTGVLFAISKIDSSAKDIIIAIGAIQLLAFIIAELAFVIYNMQDVPWQNAVGSAVAMSLLIGAMGLALMTLSKYEIYSGNLWHWVGAMAVMAIIVGGLGFVIASMQKVPWQNALGSAAALSLLLLAMSGVMFVLGHIKADPTNMTTALAALAVLGLVVWEVGAILRKLTKNGLDGSAIGAVNVISAMLIAMTVVLAACSALGLLLQNPMVMAGLAVAVVALAALGLVVWEVGAIIRKLNGAGLDASAIGTVRVLSDMLMAMTQVLAVLTVLGVFGAASIAGVAALALLGLVVWEIGAIVRKLSENGVGKNSIGTVKVLCTMLTALVDALKVLTVIGVFGVTAFAGTAILGLLALELGIAIWALSKIKDTETARANVDTIITLLSSLTSMILMISLMGPNALIATGALTILVGLVEQLSLFALAIGAVVNYFGSGADKAITKGMSILKIVAGGIGEMLGAFGEGLTDSLPEIAENLSGFADKLGGFVTVMNSIDDDIITKATNLGEAIVALTTGNILNALSSLGDDNTLATLGEDLSKFASNASDFITAMDGVKTETATNMDTFATAIGTLNEVCGDNNLSSDNLATFGESISTFATCIDDASIALSDITDEDVENIKKAATAGTALADLNHSIPRSGGDFQDIAGEQDLADWGSKISAFADSLVAYSAKVSGTAIDSDAITSSATAATAIADLNTGIPKSGGYWQDFAGEQDIATWGSKIVTFADGLIAYSDKISGAKLDTEAITNSAEAASALTEVNDALPKTGGDWQEWFGEKNLETFGSGLVSLADGLVAYSNAAAQISDDDIESIKNTATAMDEIKIAVEKIPKTGGTADWFGSRDVGAFGTGITALATGILDCIDAASACEDVSSLSNLSDAMTELELVFADVPEVNTEYTTNFKTAVSSLKSACSDLNAMCTAGYDFTGIDTIKAGIKDAINIVTDVDTQGLYEQFALLKLAIDQVITTATNLASINGTTYGGVDVLKGALDSLSDANVDGVIDAFSGKAESMTAAVNGIVNALATGLSEGSTKVSEEAANVASAAATAVEGKADAFGTAADTLISALASAFSDSYESIQNSGAALGNSAVLGASSNSSGMYTAGLDLGAGLVQGINDKKIAVYWAAYELGQKAVQGEKDGQASNSPSKLTIKAGKWLGEGLVIGMERMGNSVYKAGKELGGNAVGSISNSIRTISDAISTDIDSQPTIRPVLDLSNVRSGASAIGDMFNRNNTIGINANVNAISSMMNSRSQNGANADMVSAINKLNKKMDNLGNTTYSIGGVTYDDGSNIAEAVRTIARAAVRERRV